MHSLACNRFPHCHQLTPQRPYAVACKSITAGCCTGPVTLTPALCWSIGQAQRAWKPASTATSATNALTVPLLAPTSYSAAMLARAGFAPAGRGAAAAPAAAARATPAAAPLAAALAALALLGHSPNPNPGLGAPLLDVAPRSAAVSARRLPAEQTTATGATAAEVTAVTLALDPAAYAICRAKMQQLPLHARPRASPSLQLHGMQTKHGHDTVRAHASSLHAWRVCSISLNV